MFCKRKNGKKESIHKSGQAHARHQMERGINDGLVRMVLCLCRTIWLRDGAANLLSFLSIDFAKQEILLLYS
jgi:hypothetical protein